MDNTKEFRFESSHILSRHPGKCSRLHGHSWVLRVTVSGDIDPKTGFVMDYGDIKAAVQPIVDELDHRHLGDWVGGFKGRSMASSWVYNFSAMYNYFGVKYLPLDFYPSSENLIVRIGTLIDDQAGKKFWSKLELNETCTSSCVLTREDYERFVRASK